MYFELFLALKKAYEIETYMAQLKKIILVTGSPANSGLAYFYYLGLRDISSLPIELIDNGQISYNRTFLKRVVMKPQRDLGFRAKAQLRRILASIGGDPDSTAILIFSLGDLRPREVLSLWQTGASLYAYFSDSPFGMQPKVRQAIFQVLPLFKSVFTSLRYLVPVYYQYGAQRVHRIPFAYCRYTHLLDGYPRAPDGHLYYFGTHGPLIEKWLITLADFNLVIHGHDWGRARHPKLRAACKHPIALDHEMTKIANGQLVINFMRAEHGGCHSMKTFELPAAGACVITNRTDEQLEFFPEGSNINYFNTPDEMKKLVDCFFTNPEYIIKKINQRHEFILDQTYHQRAVSILEHIIHTH